MKPFKSTLIIIVILFSNLFAQVEFDSIVKKLAEGNIRFVSSQMNHPNISEARKAELTQGQNPFAVIVTCSDSRVPPEIIFDQGLGDLFVIRTAGEVIDDAALASIEYAVEHLDVKLIVVMGHQKCGAVAAAVEGGKLPGHLNTLTDAIAPAVEKSRNLSGDILDNAVHENISNIVNDLKDSEPILKEFVRENKLKIIGAYYSISGGEVKFSN